MYKYTGIDPCSVSFCTFEKEYYREKDSETFENKGPITVISEYKFSIPNLYASFDNLFGFPYELKADEARIERKLVFDDKYKIIIKPKFVNLKFLIGEKWADINFFWGNEGVLDFDGDSILSNYFVIEKVFTDKKSAEEYLQNNKEYELANVFAEIFADG